MEYNDLILKKLTDLVEIGYINDIPFYMSSNLIIYNYNDILYCIDIDKFLTCKYTTTHSLLIESNFLHLINDEINIMPNTLSFEIKYDLFILLYITNDFIRNIKLNYASVNNN